MPGIFDLRNQALSQAAGFRGAGSTFSSAGVVPYGDISGATNTFMTDQARQPYLANLPNYQAMLNQQTGNTLSQLQGQVPQDVITQLQQRGAERGIATGMPGSQNSNAAYLRALGLTSIGQQQQGAANLHQNIADTPVSPLLSPASLFVPEHMASQELSAAQSGGYGGGGGGYAGSSVRLPGGTLGAGAGSGVPSWERYNSPSVSGPQGGGFNSPSFSSGMWTGGANSTYAPNQGQSWENDDEWMSRLFEGSGLSDYYDTQQPQNHVPGTPTSDWSDYGNVAWYE